MRVASWMLVCAGTATAIIVGCESGGLRSLDLPGAATVNYEPSTATRDESCGTERISFEGIPAGTIVSSVFSENLNGPVLVEGTNPNNPARHQAIIFNSASPTGGDTDLGTPNQDFGGPGIGNGGKASAAFPNNTPQGKLLIVSDNVTDANSDGLVDNPNDLNGRDSTITFNFAALGSVTVCTLTVVDIEMTEVPAKIDFFDGANSLLGTVVFPIVGNNGRAVVDLGGIAGVVTAVVLLDGSGAIDDFVYSPRGEIQDCNSNQTADQDDIASGTSNDCNSNGIPDECETDCNSNGLADVCEPDADSDGLIDGCDPCPEDANTTPGICGCDPAIDCNSNSICDAREPDADSDGLIDGCDPCPDDAHTTPGICGCEPAIDCNSNNICDTNESDSDGDGLIDDCDPCPRNPNNSGGICGCDQEERDCNSNGICDDDEPDCDDDGLVDCCDPCPNDPIKSEPGICGCGREDVDCNSNFTCDIYEPDSDSNGVIDACEPNRGDEGCTPGYWKNHCFAWEATPYRCSDDFDTTFGVDVFAPDLTLLDAAGQGGGGIHALGRHAVAALMSASHPSVNYPLSPSEVISAVQQAVGPGGDVEDTKDTLASNNELGCPLAGHP